MLYRLLSIVGIFAILGVAYLFSNNKKNIKIKPIITMIVIEIVVGFAMLRTDVGITILGAIGKMFENLLSFAHEGTAFVFGGLVETEGVFFFQSLMPIIFISAIIGILNYLKILPFIIKYVGLALSKINGLGKLESYVGVASMLLGQTEIFISIKDYIHGLPKHRMYALTAPAMSSVSMGIVGSYMFYLDPSYVLAGIPLNLFGVFVIESIIFPYELSEEEDTLRINDDLDVSFFEMLSDYITDGFNTAIGVAAQLIGFTALVAFVNGIFANIFGITFQDVMGVVFSPVAFILGVPFEEAIDAGTIIATKLVTNEFVAMTDIGNITFSERTLAMMSTFLMSFANFSSIGIITGAVKSIDAKQGRQVAGFGLKLLLGSTLVSALTAAVVGIVF
ncbi:MAG: NupC/NupG family nucleoside CNT transporter [Aerococcus suis]|nr:NupC/NupG family nucleoside CNT transporter [Aerococcus suis]MDY4646318.1 nucleoside transporter C-terminal domain-containing protein [Aerococcus suis]